MSTHKSPAMPKTRLEAFSDGVLAIIITIMVLEMKVPHEANFEALLPIFPIFLSYVLSFLYVGIYWNNHHHLIAAAERINGGIMWANLHLLFWLSLIPFVTGWMGENHFAPIPTAAYGLVLLLAAIAYAILQNRIVASLGESTHLRQALGRDLKGKLSPFAYIVGMAVAQTWPWVGWAIYFGVAAIWIIPDRRIEMALVNKSGAGGHHDG